MALIFREISPDNFVATGAGYAFIGAHHASGAELYRSGEHDYFIVNPQFDGRRPACIGMVVDDDIGAWMQSRLGEPGLRVFYPGVAGPLMLNLPAVQNERDEWIYYIAHNQKRAFFALDFKPARFCTPLQKAAG